MFDYVEAGKPPRNLIERDHIHIGAARFEVSYHLISHKNEIGTVVVPNSKVRMPVIACITMPPAGFRPDEAKVLGELPEEAMTKFKEANVFAFYNSRKAAFAGPPDVEDTVNNAQMSPHDVTDGIWFTAKGVGFKIGNETSAPALYLSRYAKRVLHFYPDIEQWVRENPPPKSSIDSTLNWYRKLGAKFIEEGWHLLWRGVLYTSWDIRRASKDLDELSTELKSEVSKWPEDTRIDCFRIWSGEKFAEVSWATLKGAETSKPSNLAKLFHENLTEVYDTYRRVVDGVVQKAHAPAAA
jgi:hypothetical protein